MYFFSIFIIVNCFFLLTTLFNAVKPVFTMKKTFKQKLIARSAGCTQQHLSQIINGKCRPSWQMAKRLAEVTETTPYLWLEGSPTEIKSHLESVHDR